MSARVTSVLTHFIKHIIKKFNEELGEEIFVLATGGLGRILSAEIDEIDEYDANLSLKGLYTLYMLTEPLTTNTLRVLESQGS